MSIIIDVLEFYFQNLTFGKDSIILCLEVNLESDRKKRIFR